MSWLFASDGIYIERGGGVGGERIAVICFFSLLKVIDKILDMCSYLKDYYQPKFPTFIFNF